MNDQPVSAKAKLAPPSRNEVMRRQVAAVAKALKQRVKPEHEQDPLPYWVDGSATWDWVIECFLQDHSYDDVVVYAATPELAADVIRELAVIRREVCLKNLERDQDAAVYALSRLGDPLTLPAQQSVPFEVSEPWGHWRIMEGVADTSLDQRIPARSQTSGR